MLDSYKDLIVWQRSIELVIGVYKVTKQLPKEELYGLISQMRRCAISISSNIAEGYKRRTRGEYLQFLGIADASAAELETQIIITRKLYPEINFYDVEDYIAEIQRMLLVLMRKLEV